MSSRVFTSAIFEGSTVATLSVSCSELSEAFPQLLKPIPNIVQAIDAANVSRFIAVYGILIGV